MAEVDSPIESQGLALELDSLLSVGEYDNLRQLVMTDEEYRAFRLESATQVLGNLGIARALIEGLNESEILYWGIERAVAEFWQRDPELVFRGDLSGLPECVQDVFRPVLILPTTEHRRPVDREEGKIPLPAEVEGQVKITEDLIRAPILKNEAEALASKREGLGLASSDTTNPSETLGGLLTLGQIQIIRNNRGPGHLLEKHHMLAVHTGNSNEVGDEIQIPIPNVMHLFMHVSYCQTAYALMQRIETVHNYNQEQTREEFAQTLSPALAEIYRQSQIEFAQNAQSANAIRNSHAREYRDVEIRARFANIQTQVASETTDTGLQRILQNQGQLSPDDRTYLRARIPAGYRPTIRDIVSGNVEVDENLAAYCALHGFQQLVPNVYYPAGTAFDKLPPAIRKYLFEQALAADPDDRESDVEHVADWLGSLYLNQLFGGDAEQIEAHRMGIPPSAIRASQEATEVFLESLGNEIVSILQRCEIVDYADYVDSLIIQFSNFFHFGLYRVVEDFESSGVLSLGSNLDQLRCALPESLKDHAEEFAERFYREGLDQHRFQREQLLNLEGEFGEGYRVPGVEKVAQLFAEMIEAGKEISATFDKRDVDGIISAVTLANVLQSLTGQSLEVFTGADGGEHSLTLRSLLDLVHEKTGLVFILDRGSGAEDAEVIKKFFKGIETPEELLAYAEQYAEVLGTGGVERITKVVKAISPKVCKSSGLDWKAEVVTVLKDAESFPNLHDFLYGTANAELKLCIIDHHEVSPEMRAVLQEYEDRIVFVNPRSPVDGAEDFSHNYSAGAICHQLAIEVGKLYPDFSLPKKEQQQVWERVANVVISDLQSRLQGIGTTFDLTEDLREQLINARQKSQGVTRPTAMKHVQKAVEETLSALRESSSLTNSEVRFFEAQFYPGRYFESCGNFVENTRYCAVISTTADVMPVSNPWTRSVYQSVLDLPEEQQPYGYRRLQRASASAGDDEKSPRTTSFTWDTSYAVGFLIGPAINAVLREDLSESELQDVFQFLTNPVESNARVVSGRRLLVRAGKQRFERNERSRAEGEKSYFEWGLEKYQGRLMVAKVFGESRTGLAAGNLVGLGERQQPALVFKELGGGMISASIRAPGGNVNFADLIAMMKNEGLIIRGGGHKSACGFFALEKDLEKIIGFINERLANYQAESADTIVVDLATLQRDGANLNIFEVTKQASVNVARQLEPFGVDVPRMSYADNFTVARIYGRQRAKNESEYITVLLKDSNGNLQEVRIFDPLIINQMLDIYSSTLEFPPIRLQFSWKQRKSAKSAGIGHIEVRSKGVRQTVLREEDSRASFVVERCLGVVQSEI